MKSFKFIGKYQVSSKGHFLRRVFPPRIFRQLLCSISVVGVLHAVITHYPRPLYNFNGKGYGGCQGTKGEQTGSETTRHVYTLYI